MEFHYSSEKNVQILISLMKAHGVRRVIVSPGSENIPFVGSIQNDPYFELYSAADERSAAYIACGMAAEGGEPVALSCTAATASRNYVSGLTEAFYRKLPVLAITSSQASSRIGHHIPQVTDRRAPMPDIARISVELPVIHSKEHEWDCVIKANDALLELRRRGGGPVHINLITRMESDFSVEKLPAVRAIYRVNVGDKLPAVTQRKTAVFVGAHLRWSEELTQAVERFCEQHNGVVLCDHTSNYTGKYRVLAPLVCRQKSYDAPCVKPDLLIHIGDVSGAYMQTLSPAEVWRVNPDGELRDTFRKLTYIFEMEELAFFTHYAQEQAKKKDTGYYEQWMREDERLRAKIPELPFSNTWLGQQAMPRIPSGAVLHLGILQSLRCWNYFYGPEGLLGYCNTGGFGIDGGVSSLIGASLADSGRLYIGVVGDLAFFYDMNSIGNRHVGKNIRLMAVNNGLGSQFKVPGNLAYESGLGEATNPYIAAEGHYGRQSRTLVRHYAEDLGFEYLSADNKSDFLAGLTRFLYPEITEKPMLFEVFTDDDNERDAALIIENLETSIQGKAKQLAKGVLGPKYIQTAKEILGKF